jgi:hypothetical protein
MSYLLSSTLSYPGHASGQAAVLAGATAATAHDQLGVAEKTSPKKLRRPAIAVAGAGCW